MHKNELVPNLIGYVLDPKTLKIGQDLTILERLPQIGLVFSLSLDNRQPSANVRYRIRGWFRITDSVFGQCV